ncbi:MAG: DUF1292 domain-containing protein [Bacilli bacterium]
MEPKENEIIIYDEDGKEYLMNILFTYENPNRKTEYVFVYDKTSPDDVIVMKYNDEHELFEVTDEEELSEAEEVLNAFNDDPKIQGIKS